MCTIYACMLISFFFQSALDSSDVGYSKEGELLLVYQEEDQGHYADQGKPSILDTYLILFTYSACFHKCLSTCMFISILL
jgi:hypothetical protein